jgi:ADP-heptose:LPS heptosyltransferase
VPDRLLHRAGRRYDRRLDIFSMPADPLMPADPATSLARPPGRILIILLGSIGDVVRALPLLGRMRDAWPDAHIAWAVEPKSEPILRGHRWLNEVIVYDRRRAPWSFPPFLAEVRRGRFELVVDLQRHLKSGVIALTSGARERLGFARANVKEFNQLFSTRRIAPQPAMRLKLTQYQAFGDLLALPQTPIEFGLAPDMSARRRARASLGEGGRPRLGVILGSSWPSRIYFPEAIAAVIRSLRNPVEGSPGFFPVLLGGPEERELAAAVEGELAGAPSLNLAGKTVLSDLPAIFTECDVAFGPDSGPMHIAAAVGCPVVSLWGATAAARSAPWGFAQYALTGAIPCSPCYLRRCPIGRECMRRITPEAVVDRVRAAHAARVQQPIELGRDHELAALVGASE